MYLDDIIAQKKKRVLTEKNKGVLKYLDNDQCSDNGSNYFYNTVKKEGLSIIGEIKRASPSKGIIRKDFDYLTIAIEYQRAVDGISVITEEDYFLGSPKYLKEIAEKIEIPLLMKDFIIDEYQIYMAKFLGADAVLLIAAILNPKELKSFVALCKSISLEPLVEVHDENELDIALGAGTRIIGINNRNLSDFSVNLEKTLKLARMVPSDIPIISESGIKGPSDIQELKKVGVSAVLVGESFMTCNDISLIAKELRDGYTG